MILQVQGSPLYKNVVWNADTNLKDAQRATNQANLRGVTTTSWWCDTGGGGVAGMAYVGCLCNSCATNLNEYQNTQSGSGFVSTGLILYED